MKNPKERTALFEEISGSGALKKEYERLKQEELEAEKYQKLRDNLSDRQLELQLFKLFHNERRIGEFQEQCDTQRKELEKVEQKKDKAEEKLKEVRKEHGKSTREFAKVDSEIRERENEIQKKRPAFIKAKEKTFS